MITRCILRLLLSAMLISGNQARGDDATLPSAWCGVIGPAESVVMPETVESVVSYLANGHFTKGLRGAIGIRFSPPKRNASVGAYSATMTIFDGERVVVFRAKGTSESGDGAIDATWTAKGKPPVTAGLRLARVSRDSQRPFLLGEVTVSSQTYPVLLVPETFSKSSPYDGTGMSDGEAVPASGGPGTYNFRLAELFRQYGSGSGWSKVDSLGRAKLAGNLPDGSKFSASVPVLSDGGHLLAVAALAGKNGFLGAWAIGDLEKADSDWNGRATMAMPGHGTDEEILFALSAFNRQDGAPLGWSLGEMYLQAPAFAYGLFAVNGKVEFNGSRIFKARPRYTGDSSGILNGANAAGVKLVSLTLDPRKGLVKGAVSFFNGEVPLRSTLAGVLNQKAGVIDGRILPPSKDSGLLPGYFDIIDAASQ